MNAEQLKRIEVAVKNPEQVVETPKEIMDRECLRQLYLESNRHLNQPAGYYEAGWKAAKAYYENQPQVTNVQG